MVVVVVVGLLAAVKAVVVVVAAASCGWVLRLCQANYDAHYSNQPLT